MKIVVIGGTGRVGSNVVRRLAAQGQAHLARRGCLGGGERAAAAYTKPARARTAVPAINASFSTFSVGMVTPSPSRSAGLRRTAGSGAGRGPGPG
jgi:uncharacterized protein YbjT (DUF2867 family)